MTAGGGAGRLTGGARALAVALLLAGAGTAAAGGAPGAIAAIVIDDVGNVRHEGLRAVELPGPLTYAVIPHTPHAVTLARLAHALDKEVLVHLPMEAHGARRLGPGALTAAQDRALFERRVRAALASVPHARGASNHMGSRLTAMPRPMRWLMGVLAERHGMLFLDSRTTAQTVAEASALEAGVPATSRDVFLDNDPDPAAVRSQLRELLERARRHGAAVAIGHPYPDTLAVLRDELPRLPGRGVRLVPLSEVVARRARAENDRRLARAENDRHRARPENEPQRGGAGPQSASRDHAASTRYAPSAPSTQVSSGAPATMAGWNPSRP